MKTLFVVSEMAGGTFRSDTIEIKGKVNHHTVERAVRNKLEYTTAKWQFVQIISWQVEEEFTSEEREEFWKQ